MAWIGGARTTIGTDFFSTAQRFYEGLSPPDLIEAYHSQVK